MPVGPWGITNVARLALAPSVKAALKRACFAVVTSSVVPDDVRSAHNKPHRLGETTCGYVGARPCKEI